LQQGELSMVCVGLSERDLKNFGGPLGRQAKIWGGSGPPWHHPSFAPGYHYSLNSTAALSHPLLNKNSSELSLRLFATVLFAALKKFLVLFYRRRIYFEKPNLEMFFEKVFFRKNVI